MKILLTLLFLTSLYCFLVPHEGNVVEICKSDGISTYDMFGTKIRIESTSGLVLLHFYQNDVKVLGSEIVGNLSYLNEPTKILHFGKKKFSNKNISKCQLAK